MESFLTTLISGAVLGTIITGLFNIYSKSDRFCLDCARFR